MPYRYVAIAPSGEQVQGQIDVPNEAQAERALWDANFRVVSIRKERQLPGLEKILPSLYGVKKRALITFSRQLATLLESGVPVMRCLELLEEQAASKQLANAIRTIARDIRGGSTFADALRAHPAIFPTLYPRMVELGDLSPDEAARITAKPIPTELRKPLPPPTDYFVENGGFVKLRELSVRYKLGSRLLGPLSRLGANGVTLAAAGAKMPMR